jgi:hypothetical protein
LSTLCREQAEKKAASQNSGSSLLGARPTQPRWEDFPEIKEGEKVYQKNEGEWEFTLDESDNGKDILLDVELGKYMDTTLVKVSPSCKLRSGSQPVAELYVLRAHACGSVDACACDIPHVLHAG